MKRIAVVLPAYNEAEKIGSVIEDFYTHLSSHGYESQFFVVDDGSSDGTCDVLYKLSEKMPVVVIEHKVNRGLGAAIGTGLHQAILDAEHDDIIVTAESDGTQASEQILPLVKSIEEGADLAISSPLWSGGFKGVPWHREYLSRGGNLIYRTLFPISGLHDYTNLYRSYRASLLKKGLATYGRERLFDRTGFESVPDLLIKLRPFSPKVKEIPISIDFTAKTTSSSMSLLKTITASLSLCAHHLLHPLP